MIILPIKKAERGTHIGLVRVKRGGKIHTRKQRLGRKEKKVEYKSSHDYIETETKLDVDMREGEKFTTDSLMGEQIIVYDKNKNRLDVWIKETPNMIQLSTIGAEKKGTGIGTKYLLGLKDYADASGKKLVIPNMTPIGQKYFSQFDWLKDDHVKLEYEEGGEKQEYWAPDTMSYTPKIKSSEEKIKKSSLDPDNLTEIKSIHESGISGIEGSSHEEETFICKFKDGSSAIHKTMMMGDIIGEVGSYDTSKIIGWDVVPETIQCDYGKGKGSSQKWLEGGMEPMGDFFDGVELGEKHMNDLSKIYVMDMVLGNFDRHDGNLIIDKNDKVWAIDNECIGKKANAELHIEALEDFAKEGHGLPVPMMGVLENNFGDDPKMYQNFKDHVDKNIDIMLNKKSEIIKYWSQYKDSDVKVFLGSIPINEGIGYVKRNIEFLNDYRGKK